MTEATVQEPVQDTERLETIASDTPTTRPMTVVELAESFRDDLKFVEARARYFG